MLRQSYYVTWRKQWHHIGTLFDNHNTSTFYWPPNFLHSFYLFRFHFQTEKVLCIKDYYSGQLRVECSHSFICSCVGQKLISFLCQGVLFKSWELRSFRYKVVSLHVHSRFATCLSHFATHTQLLDIHTRFPVWHIVELIFVIFRNFANIFPSGLNVQSLYRWPNQIC